MNPLNHTSALSDTTGPLMTRRLPYLRWRSLAGRCGWFWGSQRPRPSEAEGGWPASAPVLRGRVQSVLSLPTQAPPMLLGPSGAAWNKASWETSRPEGEEAWKRRRWRGGAKREEKEGFFWERKRRGSREKMEEEREVVRQKMWGGWKGWWGSFGERKEAGCH